MGFFLRGSFHIFNHHNNMIWPLRGIFIQFVHLNWAIFAFFWFKIIRSSMTHEKSLKERKPFSKRYKHTERDISSCSHPAHGCHLSASQQPSVMAYAGQLVRDPEPRLAYQARPEPTHGRRDYDFPHFSAQ